MFVRMLEWEFVIICNDLQRICYIMKGEREWLAAFGQISSNSLSSSSSHPLPCLLISSSVNFPCFPGNMSPHRLIVWNFLKSILVRLWPVFYKGWNRQRNSKHLFSLNTCIDGFCHIFDKSVFFAMSWNCSSGHFVRVDFFKPLILSGRKLYIFEQVNSKYAVNATRPHV